MSRTIAVVGPNGSTASRIIPQLVAAGASVRSVARDPSKVKPQEGVEVVRGDLDFPRTLNGVFDGVDAVFLVCPNNPRAPQQMSSGLWAARQSRVGHVVRLSAVGAAHDAPTVNSRLHALSDSELAVSGLPFTILKPHFFMQNLLGAARTVAGEGAIYWSLGQARLGMIDVADIAAVAARILLDPSPHAGQSLTLTGPKSVDMNEVAGAFSAAIGKPVRYVPVSLQQADEGMARFLDEYMRGMMEDYLRAYTAGWGDFVTDDVPRILGRPATSIEAFARGVARAFTA
jgi:uncharacterized protein YbjT (DUF2867 family)